MNIELEEVVVLDVSDDALELAAQGGLLHLSCTTYPNYSSCSWPGDPNTL